MTEGFELVNFGIGKVIRNKFLTKEFLKIAPQMIWMKGLEKIAPQI